eukprot:1179471-Prorocentrum_minimum.AAC.4
MSIRSSVQEGAPTVQPREMIYQGGITGWHYNVHDFQNLQPNVRHKPVQSTTAPLSPLMPPTGVAAKADVDEGTDQRKPEAKGDGHNRGKPAAADGLPGLRVISEEAGLGGLALGANVVGRLLREGRGKVVDEAAVDAQMRGALLLLLGQLPAELLRRWALIQTLNVDGTNILATDHNEVDSARARLDSSVAETNVVCRPELITEEGAVVDDLVAVLNARRGSIALG